MGRLRSCGFNLPEVLNDFEHPHCRPPDCISKPETAANKHERWGSPLWQVSMGGTWRGLLHPSRIGARRLAGRSPAAWHTVRLQREVPGGDGVLRAGGRNLSPPPNTPAHTALSNLAASPTCPAVLHITDWPDRVSQLLAPGLISCPFGESFFFFFTWK